MDQYETTADVIDSGTVDTNVFTVAESMIPTMVDSSSSNLCVKGPILFVMVVGFHHKKGCQIEYCFPDINKFTSEIESQIDDQAFHLPRVWRTLPSIALPDGSHNYDRDTIFFHLPNPRDQFSTIFGVSCYRQIRADQLQNRTEDVTRATVQKSVVVLSELPLYGLIAAKCEMITFAYFNLFDFSKVDCLKELYYNLNGLLSKEHLNSTEAFLGLSPRDLITNFQHKVLILFKLILLEKKVLFFKSPVKDLCTTILSLLSLFPGVIESGGLDQCSSSVVPKLAAHSRKFSSDIELVDPVFTDKVPSPTSTTDGSCRQLQEQATLPPKEGHKSSATVTLTDQTGPLTHITEEVVDGETVITDPLSMLQEKAELEESTDTLNLPSPATRPTTPPLLKLPLSECGLPLEIFRKGSFCHPYLSLTYLDVLNDNRIRSFVIGATNILFKQKKSFFDAIVEIDGARIDITDTELKKQVSLSTEDLRFADFFVKAFTDGVTNNRTNGTVTIADGSWEGCDDWLRLQFKIYLLHLLRTSECDETSREYCSFNPAFMKAWKDTYNYKTWVVTKHPGVMEVNPGHPFHGQLSISDMKLKLSTAVMSSERGKKINQTVAQTSKAVGEALSSAKTAVSSWWSYRRASLKKDGGSPMSSFALSVLLKSVECDEAEEAVEFEMNVSKKDESKNSTESDNELNNINREEKEGDSSHS